MVTLCTANPWTLVVGHDSQPRHNPIRASLAWNFALSHEHWVILLGSPEPPGPSLTKPGHMDDLTRMDTVHSRSCNPASTHSLDSCRTTSANRISSVKRRDDSRASDYQSDERDDANLRLKDPREGTSQSREEWRSGFPESLLNLLSS